MTVRDHGDLITLDFEPQAGHEHMERRPALVLSPAAFNGTFGLALVAPVTTKPKGHAFEVPLPATSRVKGAVMVHQLQSLDWRARRARISGSVAIDVLNAATAIVKDIIDLS